MSFVLNLMGWENLKDDDIRELRKYKRLVLVFPHTTRYDFMLYFLYLLSNRHLKDNCRVLVNPQSYDANKWIMDYVGALRSVRIEDKDKGITKAVIRELSKMKRFIFLISPKGTCKLGKWRTGFYHIAKELKCHILPAGFDYGKKKFIFKKPFRIGKSSFEEVRDKTQAALKDMLQFYPANVEYPCIHSRSLPCPGLISNERIFIFIVIVVIVIIIMIYMNKRRRK